MSPLNPTLPQERPVTQAALLITDRRTSTRGEPDRGIGTPLLGHVMGPFAQAVLGLLLLPLPSISWIPQTHERGRISLLLVVPHDCLKLWCCFVLSRYLLYDVNPPEGFNLRRDVYIRIASLLKTLLKSENWVLVLPPWGRLYHWQSPDILQVRIPWSEFFDIPSLNRNIPVIEYEQFLAGKVWNTTIYNLLNI